jgi:hypothetical protein
MGKIPEPLGKILHVHIFDSSAIEHIVGFAKVHGCRNDEILNAASAEDLIAVDIPKIGREPDSLEIRAILEGIVIYCSHRVGNGYFP